MNQTIMQSPQKKKKNPRPSQPVKVPIGIPFLFLALNYNSCIFARLPYVFTQGKGEGQMDVQENEI